MTESASMSRTDRAPPRDATLPSFQGHDPTIAFYRLGGIPVSVTCMEGLIAAVGRRLARAASGTFIVFRDAHGIVRAQDDDTLRQAHETALLVCADGRPLVWIGRQRGHAGIRQVAGMDAVEAVCRGGLAKSWSHYFLGGGPGVAQKLAAEMTRRAPGLVVAGCEGLPYHPLTEDENNALRRRIQASGAQILWIGLGTPKQELFMHAHAPHLPGTIAMGVGAAFDVNIGTIQRAPKFMQQAGLEWLYRLGREPKRLFRRYGEVLPRFAALVLRDRFSRR